mgnify:CR=1 FL=1
MRKPVVTAFLGLLLLGAAAERAGAEPAAEAAKIVRLPRGTAVENLAGFGEGAWWVQDLAASLPARRRFCDASWCTEPIRA